jgi:DNA mismatch endonuclease (patch repair protein)
MGADLLLMDERIGRRIAAQRGLRVVRLLGVLVLAKDRGLVRSVADSPVRRRTTNATKFGPEVGGDRQSRCRLTAGTRPRLSDAAYHSTTAPRGNHWACLARRKLNGIGRTTPKKNAQVDMTDRLTPAKRSWNMSRIRSQNTTPERAVRSLLHCLGYRFRLHAKALPGKPDIVLAKHRAVILVHGCFWHRHPDCRYATTPGTRTAWWQAKFAHNVQRDADVRAALAAAGWRLLTVWECELRTPDALAARLVQFLPTAPAVAPEPMPLLEAAEAPAPYGTPAPARSRG